MPLAESGTVITSDLNKLYDILAQSRKIFNNVVKTAFEMLIFCLCFAIIAVYIIVLLWVFVA